MIFDKTSFAARLTIPIVFSTIGMFLVALLVVGNVFNGILFEQAKDKSKTSLKTASLYVDTSLSEVEKVVENNSWLVREYGLDTSAYSDITKKVIRDNPGIIGSIIALVPSKTNMTYAGYSSSIKGDSIVYKNISSNIYDYTAMDWYEIPILLDKPVWSEVYMDEGGADDRVTTYSYPIRDSNGEIFAIFTADISLKWLTEKAASVKPYATSANLIVSKCGAILTGDSTMTSGETIFSIAYEYNDSTLVKIGSNMIHGIEDGARFDGEAGEIVAVYGPLKNGWSILILSYMNTVMSPVYRTNVWLSLILLIGVAFIAIICNKIIKKHTLPLRQFSDVVTSITNNKLDNVLPEIKTKDEIKTLRDAIENMQISIKENLMFHEDLQSAQFIQESIIPGNSLVNEFVDLEALLEPAKEVGGDMYDYHWSTTQQKIFFTLGDVSGKGLPASLLMSMVVSTIHLAAKMRNKPSDVVAALNDNISQFNNMEMFVTLIYGVIDPASGMMELCNAGHNPMILISPDGTARYLKFKTNLVIGAMTDFPYQGDSLYLEKGSRLMIYTDGVTEAERPDKEQYGEDRLLAWASSLPQDISSHDAVASLREDVRNFTLYRKYAEANQTPIDNYPQNDDITILFVKI